MVSATETQRMALERRAVSTELSALLARNQTPR